MAKRRGRACCGVAAAPLLLLAFLDVSCVCAHLSPVATSQHPVLHAESAGNAGQYGAIHVERLTLGTEFVETSRPQSIVSLLYGFGYVRRMELGASRSDTMALKNCVLMDMDDVSLVDAARSTVALVPPLSREFERILGEKHPRESSSVCEWADRGQDGTRCSFVVSPACAVRMRLSTGNGCPHELKLDQEMRYDSLPVTQALLMLLGTALFFASPWLAGSSIFVYSTSTLCLALLMALMIAYFIANRLTPGGMRTTLGALVFGGAAFVMEGFRWTLYSLLPDGGLPWAVGAVLVPSFVAVYLFFNATDSRRLDVAKQLSSILLPFFGAVIAVAAHPSPRLAALHVLLMVSTRPACRLAASLRPLGFRLRIGVMRMLGMHEAVARHMARRLGLVDPRGMDEDERDERIDRIARRTTEVELRKLYEKHFKGRSLNDLPPLSGAALKGVHRMCVTQGRRPNAPMWLSCFDETELSAAVRQRERKLEGVDEYQALEEERQLQEEAYVARRRTSMHAGIGADPRGRSPVVFGTNAEL